VNGEPRELEIDVRTTLLDALRERLHLTGTKKGCDHGQCGACTVLVEGRRVNSCLTLAVMHDGDRIVTIEGLGIHACLLSSGVKSCDIGAIKRWGHDTREAQRFVA
jgi:aerobic-type carbon monoxide dehydrogenase small subunit (CoxS/CutS family)